MERDYLVEKSFFHLLEGMTKVYWLETPAPMATLTLEGFLWNQKKNVGEGMDLDSVWYCTYINT